MVFNYIQLMDYGALFTLLVPVLALSIACCTWCYCIRANDKAMQHYIKNLAQKKGVEIKPYTLATEPCPKSFHSNENCFIYVPDVGIIL